MTGPLAGLRVLEIAGVGPGPHCAMLLADMGADVLRIDRVQPRYRVHARTDLLNRGRRSAALDLKQPRAVEAVLALAERADVLLEGFRPGVMERLGLGPEAAMARNPRLVYARLTGWGQDGPLAGAAGHDLNYLALTGALHAIGPASGPPVPPLNLAGDFGGGALYAAVGILAALFERGTSGKGQVVDASIVDGAASLMTFVQGLMAAGWWRDEREANLIDGGAPFYRCYETADGKWVALGAIEPEFYDAFLQPDRPRRRGAAEAHGPGPLAGADRALPAALPDENARGMVRPAGRHRRLLRARADPGGSPGPPAYGGAGRAGRKPRRRPVRPGAPLLAHARRALPSAARARRGHARGTRDWGLEGADIDALVAFGAALQAEPPSRSRCPAEPGLG